MNHGRWLLFPQQDCKLPEWGGHVPLCPQHLQGPRPSNARWRLAGGTRCPAPSALTWAPHTASPVGLARSSEPEAATSHMRHRPLGVSPHPGAPGVGLRVKLTFGKTRPPSLGLLASPLARPSPLFWPEDQALRAWHTLWSGHSRFLLGKPREGAAPPNPSQ